MYNNWIIILCQYSILRVIFIIVCILFCTTEKDITISVAKDYRTKYFRRGVILLLLKTTLVARAWKQSRTRPRYNNNNNNDNNIKCLLYTTTTLANRSFLGGLSMTIIIIITATAGQTTTWRLYSIAVFPSANFPTFGSPSGHHEENCRKTTVNGIRRPRSWRNRFRFLSLVASIT